MTLTPSPKLIYGVYVRCYFLSVVDHVEINRYLEKLREERFVNEMLSRRLPAKTLRNYVITV